MVGVHVGQEDRFDPHSVFVRDGFVVSDLELRIDDRGAALAASTENVRRAAGCGVEHLSKDHETPRSGNGDVTMCVSRMRAATMTPEANVIAATATIALR